jgi:hypothetical protein
MPDPTVTKDIDRAASNRVVGPLEVLWNLGQVVPPSTPVDLPDDSKAFESAAREVWQVKK